MAVWLIFGFACQVGLSCAVMLDTSPRKTSSTSLTLDENGYSAVAAEKSDAAMKEFILKVVDKNKGAVKDYAALNGMLRFYSGVTATQNYQNLIRELAGVVWIDWSKATAAMKAMRKTILGARAKERHAKFKRLGKMGRAPGGVAKLTEQGYHEVVEVVNDDQMETFIKRLIVRCGGVITDLDKLQGLVPFYSGSSDGRSQSFSTLVQELKDAPWISNFSSDEACAPEAMLNEEGYGRVTSQGSFASTELFIRRAIFSVSAKIDNDAEFEEFVYSHNGANATGKTFSQLTRELKDASWISGYTIPLSMYDMNEEGYQRFVDLRSNGDMGRFARLLISARGGRIIDTHAFTQSLPEYSGNRGQKNFAELSKFLEGASFVAWGNDGPVKLPEITSSTHASDLKAAEERAGEILGH